MTTQKKPKKIIPNDWETKKGPMDSPFEGVNSLSLRQCSQKPKKEKA